MHLSDICLEWEAAWGWEQEHDWVLQKTVPDVGDRATQVESEPCFVKRKGPSRGVLTGSPEAGEEPREWPGYSWGRPRSVPPPRRRPPHPHPVIWSVDTHLRAVLVGWGRDILRGHHRQSGGWGGMLHHGIDSHRGSVAGERGPHR